MLTRVLPSFLLLILILGGCQETTAPGQTDSVASGAATAQDPSKAPPETQGERIVANDELFEPPHAPSSAPPPLRDLARSGPADSRQLARLAADPQAKAALRLVSIRRLESLDPQAAVTLSHRLALDPQSDDAREARLLRNNAVAALLRAAQEGQPRALEALAELESEPNLRELVATLRRHASTPREVASTR